MGIGAEQLDSYIDYLLQAAVLRSEPHLIAVLEGDDRYQRSLDAVEAARLELETYRAAIRVSDVGAEAWKRDVATRQAALDLARGELRSLRAPPRDPYAVPTLAGESFSEWLPRHEREVNAQFLDRVVVRPVGQGKRVPVAERVAVYFLGAEEPWTEPEGDPEIIALLSSAADAATIRADFRSACREGRPVGEGLPGGEVSSRDVGAGSARFTRRPIIVARMSHFVGSATRSCSRCMR